MQLRRKNKEFIYWIIFLIAVAFYTVFRFEHVLKLLGWLWRISLPLVLGGCIAFVVNLLMVWLEKKVFKKIKRKVLREALSLIGALLIILLVIVIVLAIAIPQLIKSFYLLSDSIPKTIASFRVWANEMAVRFPDAAQTIGSVINDNTDNLGSTLQDFFRNGLPKTLMQTYSYASETVGAAATFVIGLMFSFYILMSKERLGKQIRQLLYSYLPEKKANRILYIAHLTSDNFNAFIFGQCMEALILFFMYIVVAFIFRLPYSFMIAVMIGVFSLIPLFGAWIGWAIGVFLIITVDPLEAVTFSIIFLLISQIEGNFIYPRIVGSSIGLPGIWVLAAVTIGGNMLGIIGMIIAVPIAALVYTLLSESTQKILKEHPDRIPEIVNKPNWKDFDPETDRFEDHPVKLENVFAEYYKEHDLDKEKESGKEHD